MAPGPWVGDRRLYEAHTTRARSAADDIVFEHNVRNGEKEKVRVGVA